MGKTSKEYDLDNRGGAIVLPKRMIDSNQFKALSANAQIIAVHLHSHWSFWKPIDFGCREGADILHASKTTASRALKELADHNFIIQEDESVFLNVSSTGNQPRKWSLTWLPFQTYGKAPSKKWEKPP